MIPDRPYSVLKEQPYPLLFITLSGAHLYGFPSEDSDFDLRGAHVTPASAMLSLDSPRETIEAETYMDGPLDELVTHDIRKYLKLLLKSNGYVLEQIFSPIVIYDSLHLAELRSIAGKAIGKHQASHYLGFAERQWKDLVTRPRKTAKRILYVLRVLMTGVHMMKTGKVEANILTLNEEFRLPYVPELVEIKRTGDEGVTLPAGHRLDFYEREFHRLMASLEEARDTSVLPDAPRPYEELNRFLLTMRSKFSA